MNKSPKVSVMMPAYNASSFIEAAIESVRAQTYADWELICYDDGSKDNTADIVSKIAKKDSRVKLVRGIHGGRGLARNAALLHCNGEYVAMCDADDVSFPLRFEKQVDFLQKNPEISAVGAYQIPFSGKIPFNETKVIEWPTSSDAISNNFNSFRMAMPNCVVMIRRSCFTLFGDFDKELLRCQDFGFFLKLHFSGCKFCNLNEPLIYYRQEGLIPSFDYWSENEKYHVLAIRKVKQTLDLKGGITKKQYKGKLLHLRYLYFCIKRWLEAKG